MEWETLRAQWQQSPTGGAPDPRGLSDSLWRKVRRRDGLETFVAVLLLPVFGVSAWLELRAGNWLTAGFAILLVLAVAYIPWHLWRVRRKIPANDPGRPVRDYLVAARAAADAQATQMRNVAWWYSSPIAVGAIGFVGAQREFDTYWLVYAGVVIAITLGINWLNKRAADRVFDVAAKDIDEQLRNLEELQ